MQHSLVPNPMARKYQNAVPSGHTILVIDDSPDIVQSSRFLLEAEGHEVEALSDPRQAEEVALRHPRLVRKLLLLANALLRDGRTWSPKPS